MSRHARRLAAYATRRNHPFWMGRVLGHVLPARAYKPITRAVRLHVFHRGHGSDGIPALKGIAYAHRAIVSYSSYVANQCSTGVRRVRRS